MSLSGNAFPSGFFLPLSDLEPLPMDFFTIPSPKDYFMDYNDSKIGSTTGVDKNHIFDSVTLPSSSNTSSPPASIRPPSINLPKPVVVPVPPKSATPVETKKKDETAAKDGEWSTVTRKPKHKKEKAAEKTTQVEKVADKPSVPGKTGPVLAAERSPSEEGSETVDTK